MNAINTDGLGKRYRQTWALRDCHLTVPAGHVAALVGPNGAGKTTLLAMALALLLGVTIRRVLPAMVSFAVTFGGCVLLDRTWLREFLFRVGDIPLRLSFSNPASSLERSTSATDRPGRSRRPPGPHDRAEGDDHLGSSRRRQDIAAAHAGRWPRAQAGPCRSAERWSDHQNAVMPGHLPRGPRPPSAIP
jgi:energy-coupling factor transporter ATP-binding protein EcfA2